MIRFVAPGPDVAMVTPSLRLTRQTASAAMAADCSCCMHTTSMLAVALDSVDHKSASSPRERKYPLAPDRGQE